MNNGNLFLDRLVRHGSRNDWVLMKKLNIFNAGLSSKMDDCSWDYGFSLFSCLSLFKWLGLISMLLLSDSFKAMRVKAVKAPNNGVAM